MKKVLITGASGGIGLETAKQLAAHGYQLTLVARNEEKLKEVVKSLSGIGHTVFAADLSNEVDLRNLVSLITREKFDVLINNAGAGLYGKFVEMSLADQLAIMQLNMDALVTLSYAFLQNATNGDALVNIASLLGHSSFPGASVYAATKSFVANFSESLWYEFKPKGIFIMGFNPGATSSEFHSNAGGESADFPQILMAPVKDVAVDLIKALEKRSKPRVVQSWINRLILFGFRFTSRKMGVNVMGRVSPGMRS